MVTPGAGRDAGTAASPPPCISCGRVGRRLGWSVRWELWQCDPCGVAYPANWREQLAGTDFHAGNEDYYRALENRPTTGLVEQRLRHLLQDLGREVRGRSMLDVGCGRGECVEVAVRLGWNALGLDLASTAVELCRARGVPAMAQSFFDEALSPSRFDLIVMSELVEHVPNADAFLARARELLAPGGLVYLTTPNFDALGRRVFGDDWNGLTEGHVALRSVTGVERLARRAGLEPVRLETANLSPAAVRRILTRRRGGRPVPGAGGPAEASEQEERMQALRERIYASRLLVLAKHVLDVGVRASGLGETIRARLRRA